MSPKIIIVAIIVMSCCICAGGIFLSCRQEDDWNRKSIACEKAGATWFWTEKKCIDVKTINVNKGE